MAADIYMTEVYTHTYRQNLGSHLTASIMSEWGHVCQDEYLMLHCKLLFSFAYIKT